VTVAKALPLIGNELYQAEFEIQAVEFWGEKEAETGKRLKC